MKATTSLAFVAAIIAGLAGLLDAQGRGGAPGAGRGGGARGPRAGTVERITVHGKALEANREGDSPDRNVTVYLPPSYAQDQARRYPVVYLLHGYGLRDDAFTGPLAALAGSADALAPAQGFSEMIVVTPDASTMNKGNMYSNSPATGDWERFVAEDLVGAIDARYRTLAGRMSRGLGGHAMGGYGALRIGMKRPDVFSSLYFMSSCCVAANVNPSPESMPLEMLEQHAANLSMYYAVAMDIGTADSLLATNRQLHDAMARLRIAHGYEEYDGDHTNRLQERIARHVLPFFSKNLAAAANPSSPPPQR